MMDETLKFVEEYLDNEKENALPKDVPESHKHLMYAIKHVSIVGKKERGELEKKITELSSLFLGENPDRSNGLIEQIKTNTRFRKTFTWVLIIIATAFLGGAGAYFWNAVIN